MTYTIPKMGALVYPLSVSEIALWIRGLIHNSEKLLIDIQVFINGVPLHCPLFLGFPDNKPGELNRQSCRVDSG